MVLEVGGGSFCKVHDRLRQVRQFAHSKNVHIMRTNAPVLPQILRLFRLPSKEEQLFKLAALFPKYDKCMRKKNKTYPGVQYLEKDKTYPDLK